MARSQLYVGKLVQEALNVINPIQQVIWYAYTGQIVDDAGLGINNYIQTILTARVQPVSDDLLFKNNLEFGYLYKRFYILLDRINTVNRSMQIDSDYLFFDNYFWRIMKVPEQFLTGWVQVIGMMTNESPV